MAFYKGQKVVCVDASPPRYHKTSLVLNAVYTISGFDTEDEGSELGIYLVEVPNEAPRPPWKYPDGWRASRFRPLIERKQSTDTGFAILLKCAGRAEREKVLVDYDQSSSRAVLQYSCNGASAR